MDPGGRMWQEAGKDYIMRSFITCMTWMTWTGHVACMEDMIKGYRILVGKPEGRRPCGRHRHRWENNIRMDLRVNRC
jgi:hypothetical protein